MKITIDIPATSLALHFCLVWHDKKGMMTTSQGYGTDQLYDGKVIDLMEGVAKDSPITE